MSRIASHAETEKEKECRILITGYSGSGKSSLGNKLIGKSNVEARSGQGNLLEGDQPRAGFLVSRGFDSATRKSQYQTGRLHRHDQTLCLKVVDTPGLFDPRDKELSQAKVEILRGLFLSFPGGPHAVLFVVPFGRFTEQEDQAFQQILQLLGKEVHDHLVVVFTHGEDVDDNSIEDFLAHSQVPGLQNIWQVVGNRYMVSTNVPERRDHEVKALMDKVVQVSDDCAKSYRKEGVQLGKIEADIQELMQKGMAREEAVQKVGAQLLPAREEAVQKVGARRFGGGFWMNMKFVVAGAVVVLPICLILVRKYSPSAQTSITSPQ